MQKKPNILFILTDDQRFDTIHALGNPAIHTPNLDRLAARGTAFRRAHIPSGTCGAVCMPSRAMLNTGRHLFHLEDLGQDIPESHITMGQAFRENGWQTIGIGKWHNGCPAYARSFETGGSIFFGGMWDHWNVPVCRYDPSGQYDNTINFVVNFFDSNRIIQQHCDEFVPGKHSSELLTDTAISMLRKHAGGEKPFFLYLAYLAPHDPRTMPEKFRKMYDPEKMELPVNFQETISMEYPLMQFRDENLAAYPRNPDEIRRHIAEYYGMISHLDAEIGRLLDALEESGEADNTIIVFTGDNGLAVGQHGFMGKEDIFDHSVRVPLILSGPGIPKGEQNGAYVYLYDIFPTLCGLCGVPVPDSVDGKSFVHLFSGGEKHRDRLYLAFDNLIRGIKEERYKLIEYAVGPEEKDCSTFVFDLEEDPFETRNLAGLPEYAPVLERLRGELAEASDEWEESRHRMGVKFWQNYRHAPCKP